MGKDESPAARDALWVLWLSVLAGSAGAWLGWQTFGVIGAVLGCLAFLLTTKRILVAVLLDRFLSRVLGTSIRLRPSRTDVSDTARGHVDQLRALGFVAGETLTMVDDNDHVLGGPYAMLSHSNKPIAAWVGPVNVTIGSELPEGRLLLTTNQPHVPTDRLVVQVFGGKQAEGLLQHHEEALSRLAPTAGADANPRRVDPQHILVTDEECERAYFGGLSRLERVRHLQRLTQSATPSDVGV
jgi:hypothetical protein